MAAWTFGLSVVSIMAAGVVVAGFLHTPEPELTTALPTTTTTAPEPEQPEYSYVTPSVTYPTQIPGCDVVERPGGSEWIMYSSVDEYGYDNPDFPWFSGPKAGAMSQALWEALPAGAEVEFASPERSLIFQPIMSNGASGEDAPDVGGDTSAVATVLRNGKPGSLSVSVEQNAEPVPACVAGYLDARRVLADGTVVDVLDTWSETNGVRTLSRSAQAYVPDGTRISANSTDTAYRDDETNSGTVPVTVDELVAMVTAPGLRVTAPVPPETVTPLESCNSPVEQGSGPAIDRATAERFDAVLAALPLDGIALDRPLGMLRPARLDDAAVCQSVRVTTTPGQEATLDIAIAGGQELPPTSAAPEPGGTRDRTTVRQLPDGTVVEHSEHDFTSMGTRPGSEAKSTTRRAVTVTRPSGTMIRTVSAADAPAMPLSFEQLDAIALAPGIEVPR